MFGDPAGRPCYEVLHGRAALCEVCASDKVFEEGQSHIWEWSAPQGFAFQIYDYPFTDTDGAPLVLELGIDITARKQAEEALKEKHAMVMRTLQGTVMALSAAVERRDPYTAGHQRRVTQLALALGREFGLDPERLEGLEVACLLHDIGKIAIPAEILSKPGMLNDFEFNMIKSHPQVAFEILKGIIFPWPVTQIIAQHHERVNGSGYPFGLEGEDILLESRILGVADVVEAMASHRPYRPALGIDEALAEVSQKQGVLYDPEVVAACLRLFKEQGFTLE
jgi:putative nucleotidyltransferase with HDIG domain